MGFLVWIYAYRPSDLIDVVSMFHHCIMDCIFAGFSAFISVLYSIDYTWSFSPSFLLILVQISFQATSFPFPSNNSTFISSELLPCYSPPSSSPSPSPPPPPPLPHPLPTPLPLPLPLLASLFIFYTVSFQCHLLLFDAIFSRGLATLEEA